MRGYGYAAPMLLIATLVAAQDFDRTLDLPVERPAKIAQVQSNNSILFKRKTVDVPPLPLPPPPEDHDDGPPPTFFGQEIKSSNQSVFYVLDISGSMAYGLQTYASPDGSTRTGSRLDRAKAELTRSISSLPDDFKFNVLAYDCAGGQVFAKLTKAIPASKAAAIAWTNALKALGGTGTGPAVCLAMSEEPVGCVVVLSDGAPNCGTLSGEWGGGILNEMTIAAHREMIRAGNRNGSLINTFGIACEGQFRDFMIGVASDNGGTYVDCR